MVDFLCGRGVEGASVLEVGGGVGEIQVELLRRGAARVTNLEISTGYEGEARRLLERSGLGERVTRRFLDIATAPDDVEPADIVVLHRVVCCYPDYEALLSASGTHAKRLLVFSHPPDTRLARGATWLENLPRRLGRRSFRTFVHPPAAMLAVLAGTGLSPGYVHDGWPWCVVGLER
jgi:magnesium-protoporphyrin O-methyltransferase